MSSSSKDHDALVPMPPAPVQSATTPDGQRVQPDAPAWNGWLDRAISVQRPVVVAHVARVRRRHPDASPAQVVEILERQYLTAVTSGGAAVGASAVIPGVGMIASLGLSGAETVGFLEASALFAQSVTEVHGITVEDPERARALVMAMMLGAPGTQLVKQLAGQASGGQGRTAFWGELVTSSLPKSAISGIGGKLRASFVKRFLTRQGTSILGRAIPFGIGAVVGGLGNHALGRKVVQSSRTAFGPPPAHFTVVLQPSGGEEQQPPKRLSKRQQRALERGRDH
ncbi:hypothetical protein [Curtobacterium herbarum]|uniref:Di-and tripeptidase n=1 Tax=Curtobacterium herbarum TaxID=150122 RepID=A0ABP4K9G4_9MICO|nr:hypothetical protein [Curtobacterium herbarum]MBM7475560.1 hypothetical protein [Curtobacterium herbarum]MCS6543474.1 hypothetical protein [Curtobacterium herbarum]